MNKIKFIDDKIKIYAPIMEECYEYGIKYVLSKYKDSHIRSKLIEYTPIRYAEYMKDKCGIEVNIDSDVYRKIRTKLPYKNRKKREHSNAELKKIEETHNERIALYNELISLGSTMKYKEDIPLTYLREKILRYRNNNEKIKNKIQYYIDFYNKILDVGYKSACCEYKYTGSMSNLKKRLSKYVEQYNKNDF